MPIAFYHLLHVYALISLVSSMTYLLLTEKVARQATVLYGVSSLFMLVSGMGMTHKYSFSMASFWIVAKIFIWFLLSMSVPIIAKRMPHLKIRLFRVSMALIFLAAYFAIIKPS